MAIAGDNSTLATVKHDMVVNSTGTALSTTAVAVAQDTSSHVFTVLAQGNGQHPASLDYDQGSCICTLHI